MFPEALLIIEILLCWKFSKKDSVAPCAKDKREDLGLDPQHPHQKSNTASHIHNASAGEEETGRFQRLARQPAYTISKLQALQETLRFTQNCPLSRAHAPASNPLLVLYK